MSDATSTAVEGAYEASDAGLKKQITLFGLIALAVSVQIGSGWLLATLAAASIAGPASIISWILGAVFFGIIGATWMELGTMLPRSGAGVRYPRLTHGAFLSWFNGWGYLIAAIALPVIELQAVITYVGGHWPQLGLLKESSGTLVLSWPRGIVVGFVLMGLFFVLNSLGAKLLSESNKYITIWKLVIPVLTAVLMFTAFNSSNLTVGGGFAPLGVGTIFGAMAGGGIVFAYSGIRQILDFGGEVINPQRNIPIAIIVGGLLIPLFIYMLLQVAFVGAIHWSATGLNPGDWTHLLDSKWASAPLLNAVEAAGFTWFAVVLLTDAALSPMATGWVWLGIGSRSMYSMSVNGELPKPLQTINKYGTPIVALFACTAIGLFFFFPAPSWYSFVGQVSTALVLSYLMGGPVLATLRRTAPRLHRPVRLKIVGFWAFAGYAASLFLIYFAGWVTLINLLTVVFLALPIYGAYTSVRSGWSPKAPSWILSAVFTIAWFFVAGKGGWLFTADQKQSAGGWSFGLYGTALLVLIAGFVIILYAMSTAEGKRHVAGGSWIVGTLTATLFVAYFGQYGPMTTPTLGHQTDLVVMALVAVGSYLWAIRTGGPTEELSEILAANEQAGALDTPDADAPDADAPVR
ncbi:putative amino acid-proton symporter ybeC [Nostocoides japonicum T1-X7]|uniref:Putative amino acid-proton symporter ybeC n=1 Tax=Nostocoides japonicum T1-X7 TaxID=1194083 RepID=A0A077M198_9MICO|nr:APC family permease [Tetrasphaera japonica]CCH79596.1 putative amino acid-proton symporter ybeC [Tetrasphaera japonica T1-X7]